MIKAAIAGATGYTGGELIRILLNHPQVELASLLTTSLAGQSVASIHKDLYGDCSMQFTNTLGSPDVIFLCLGHGLSRKFLTEHPIPAHCKIIDLGNDFRTDNVFNKKTFVYGIPELFREAIQQTNFTANPGCFATAIILGLAPVIFAGLLAHDVCIHAITGSTGAGKQPSETSHFSYRFGNISVYKPFIHQHLTEIRMALNMVHSTRNDNQQPATTSKTHFLPMLNFIPIRGDFARGIFSSILARVPDGISAEVVSELYQTFYSSSPFVHFSDVDVSLKEVINTNKALINIHLHNNYLQITSIIDNLLKGAAGQAVQNMNLMFGLPEECGLRLKGIAF